MPPPFRFVRPRIVILPVMIGIVFGIETHVVITQVKSRDPSGWKQCDGTRVGLHFCVVMCTTLYLFRTSTTLTHARSSIIKYNNNDKRPIPFLYGHTDCYRCIYVNRWLLRLKTLDITHTRICTTQHGSTGRRTVRIIFKRNKTNRTNEQCNGITFTKCIVYVHKCVPNRFKEIQYRVWRIITNDALNVPDRKAEK